MTARNSVPQSPASAAAALIRAFDLDSAGTGVIDVDVLLYRIGATVSTAMDSGLIVVDGEDDQNVVIHLPAASEPARRQQIAHAAGHLCLHLPELPSRVRSRLHCSGVGPQEAAADVFAACLLMPEDVYNREIAIAGDDDATSVDFLIALRFDVPVALAALRRSIGEPVGTLAAA